jgi:hypothetical protein
LEDSRKINRSNTTKIQEKMKYIIVLGDGMADEPIAQLGNKTPLQVAHTPTMDLLAKKGRSGMLDTVPEGFAPGSEIANLSVMGYDVPKVYEGRAYWKRQVWAWTFCPEKWPCDATWFASKAIY